jgi:hypothetical protein
LQEQFQYSKSPGMRSRSSIIRLMHGPRPNYDG